MAQTNAGKLSDVDFADKIEDFFMACLELKLMDWAELFLKALCNMFPDGIKTMRLMAMWYEANGAIIKAQEIYNEIIESCPTDSASIKRLVCLYKHNNDISQSVKVLNKYLEVNMTDEDAWLELADIHLSKQNFTKAQYCLEEVLVINPRNPQFVIRLAETVMSGADNNVSKFELARKYFAHSLMLLDDEKSSGKPAINVPRALFGLLKACKKCAELNKKEDEKNTELLSVTKARISKVYKNQTSIAVDKMTAMK